MPIYEFECGACGERFERLVDIGTETATCTNCGAAGAERKLSSFGLTRQPTPGQRRRMEDARGTNRDGARQRFQKTLDTGRARNPRKPPPPAK
jgi:putative FmdB family regulatory protein